MSNETIKIKDSFIIEDGEVKDLTIRFKGNLNEWIMKYFNNPVGSSMHKVILRILDRVIKESVDTGETED